jgi:hypothetical protein
VPTLYTQQLPHCRSTEHALSREGGESNVGLTTNENKLQHKPDGIRRKETISKVEHTP